MFTVKFIVLIVAFATQCVYAKSRNGYGYFDEKFCVLEWITYLKRLSLIALMLCGIVLYYVPKSRSYARRACCILIDTVANGLKFALNIDEIEKIKARYENENKELRIQELYRKVYEENTRNGQKYINKTNLDKDNHKSIRKHKSKKFRAKHTIGGKHERYRYNRHHQNAINNMLPESNAVITAKFKTPSSQKQENMSNSDTNKKMQTKQNFDCMHEEVAILSQRQSSKDCVTMTINKQMDSRYDRVKPVLLRVVNWFFGGCPESSKRHREQIDEVGKEEIFESTNTWLL
ncbi:uncharacterized protein [Mycetomoellerius zeteki]|uniref:uncharacterized protein isoform X2 n=1 Tax=Mycetomoellerius zeteki TaxID=64791 RepID=UPI00084E5CCB|nr:PREDICTED: uncharacterized protein LOC108731255 isoform X2 [Trachymyrmex zeteki]